MAKDKRQFEHESLEDAQSVVEYLKAVTEGLSNGGVRFQDKEGKFTLQMNGLVEFQLRATRKRNKAQLMLKGPLEWLGDFPAAGWHLTSAQLRKYASAGRPFPEGRLLAASCHDAEELALAASMGVEFVTLSPVQPTESHPGEPALGWDKAAELIAGFNQPVYLLGGLGPQQAEQAWEHGAQGVAGIRAFWPGGL